MSISRRDDEVQASSTEPDKLSEAEFHNPPTESLPYCNGRSRMTQSEYRQSTQTRSSNRYEVIDLFDTSDTSTTDLSL